MHIEGLDELDNKILEMVKDNARLTYSEIGEKVGVSRISVRKRMEALEEKGIIYENNSAGVGINFATVGSAIRKAVALPHAKELFDEDWQEDIVKYHRASQAKRRK